MDSATESPAGRVLPGHVLPGHVLDGHVLDVGPSEALRTIQAAAELAGPGTLVRVQPGVYRERVAPPRGGTPDRPIRFLSVEPGRAVVRGSDVVADGWQATGEAGVWQIPIRDLPGHDANADASAAGGPFNTVAKRTQRRFTLGQLFLNDAMLTQSPRGQRPAAPGCWSVDPDAGLLRVWLPHGLDPRAGGLELTTRGRIFAPHRRGLGHIHVEGFTFERCGNQFPSGFYQPAETPEGGAPQAGAVSTRSGHHWRIYNCTIRHAMGIGLDCGGEGARDVEGDQPHPDGVYSRPVTCGFHEVRGNVISDNGACGLAAAGSRSTRILGNLIERNNALGFAAPEIAGIKVHFFFDGLIEGNVVRDTDAHGIWLDNQWYGTRVTRNLVTRCTSGVFVELGSGHCLVDHNVIANCTDGIYAHDTSGITVAHNLLVTNRHFGIYARLVSVKTPRATEDEHGIDRRADCRDNRFVNNVFIDNYRGHVCLPLPDETHCPNVCDHNLLINGSQWHWEGSAFHRFCFSYDDGRPGTSALAEALAAAGLDPRRFLEAGPSPSPGVSLATWRQLAGYDLSSHEVAVGAGTMDVGAVDKGTFSFANLAMRFDAAAGESLTGKTCPPLDGLERDFFGQHRPAGPVLPGPFATIAGGPVTFDLAAAWNTTRHAEPRSEAGAEAEADTVNPAKADDAPAPTVKAAEAVYTAR